MHATNATSNSKRVLGIQTLVFILAWHVLYPLSHFPSPRILICWSTTLSMRNIILKETKCGWDLYLESRNWPLWEFLPSLDCILEEPRCLHEPGILGVSSLWAMRLHPPCWCFYPALALCHWLNTVVLVGYEDVLHGHYPHWLMTQLWHKSPMCNGIICTLLCLLTSMLELF